MAMLPKERPRMQRLDLENLAKVPDNFFMFGVRGYYRDSMGVAGENDIGIYDDAIFLVTPNVFAAFNANVDPSIRRKNIATLVPGEYLYKLGTHGLSKPKEKRYRALVQAGPVTVKRADGPTQTGFFGINIHKGSVNSTSSEGCQTIYPSQWEAFITTIESESKRLGRKTIIYKLHSNV